MAEALSEAAAKSIGIKILKSGGDFLIEISTDSVEVVELLTTTATTLVALYAGYQLFKTVIDAVIKKTLGGERDDQEVKDIRPGSLHVVLHCFTDERFLEVLTDYLSGKMKERLQEEFLQVKFKVKGLKVEIQNMDEVNEIKEAIYKRSHINKNLCDDVKNTAMDDGESDIKKNGDEMESQMSAAVRRKQDEIVNNLDDIKKNVNELKATQNQLKANQDEMKASQDKIKENIEEIKKTQAEIKEDQVMLKAEVREQFKTVTDMLLSVTELLQGRNVNNNGAQATQETTLAMKTADNNQFIIILGGSCGSRTKDISNTVEKFNIAEGKSTELPPMKKPRTRSASCVYNGDVMITGGYDGQDGDDSIEILNMNQQPLQWKMFRRKLPFKLHSHTVTVHHNNIYVVGGYNRNENRTSDEIHEISLIPPYTVKLLARMPQARRNHRTEIVNEKLFIFGGSTTWSYKDALDSVVVYDFITDELKTCPSLPEAVCKMSTITWGNKIIVIGGVDKNNQVLNDVITYDTETGRSETLPSLRHKRYGHSAVIIDDVIAVLGGWNKEQGHLNSVESFTMGSDDWKELPGMKEKRAFATAIVTPRPIVFSVFNTSFSSVPRL